MTDTLTTAIGNVIDRIVLLEKVVVTDVGTRASSSWWYIYQQVPYWVNRAGGLRREGPVQKRWIQDITARLVVAHVSAMTRADGSGDTPQDNVWEYIPDVVRYFEANKHLAPSGYSAIRYLAPEGVTITCPRGLDVFNIPGQAFTALYIDFEFTVPYQIFD